MSKFYSQNNYETKTTIFETVTSFADRVNEKLSITDPNQLTNDFCQRYVNDWSNHQQDLLDNVFNENTVRYTNDEIDSLSFKCQLPFHMELIQQ